MFSRYSRLSLGLLAAALYSGPLLAGLSRQGWAVLPVFTALFLLYLAASRKPDLSTGVGWAALAGMAGMQVLLVLIFWGAGLGLTSILGAVALPLWAPLALTGAAAGFGAWAFRDAAEMEVMLDSAIAVIDAQPGGIADWPDMTEETSARVAETAKVLRHLPLEARRVDPIVQALEAELGIAAFDAFYDLSGEPGDEAVDFGLLRFISSPDILSELMLREEGGLAPMLLLDSPHPAVRAEARDRIADLVDFGEDARMLPDPAWLRELHACFPGEGYDKLSALFSPSRTR